MAYSIVIISFCISIPILIFTQRLFLKRNYTDKIISRSSHKSIATRSGGVSIFLILFLISLYFYLDGKTLFDYSFIVPLSLLTLIGLYDDISNKVKTGKFFNPKDSFADDVSNVSGIIAGASDVVGLIPGLEWVAGVGNAIGGVGGIVKMFGDHDKNVKTAQDDANKFKPEKDISNAPSSYIGTIDQTAQSNIRQPTTSAGVY